MTLLATYDAATGLQKWIPREEDVSVEFCKGDDERAVRFPAGVASFYVTGSYSSGTAAALRVRLQSSSSWTTVSTVSGSPTSAATFAGQAVSFGITGPSGDVTVSVGLKLNYA